MRKRILSCIMAMFLLLSVFPVNVLAAENVETEDTVEEPTVEVQKENVEEDAVTDVQQVSSELDAPVAGADVTTIQTGKCGDDATFVLTSDGTLTISGSGKIYDNVDPYSYEWLSNRSKITKLVIEDGIENVPKQMFNYSSSIETIELGSSIKEIDDQAFYNCLNLKTVFIPDGVITIGDKAFLASSNITFISLPSSLKTVGDAAFIKIHYPNSLEQIEYRGTVEEYRQIQFAENNDIEDLIRFPGENGDYILSGICGETVAYSLDRNGHFRIWGSGNAYNYNNYQYATVDKSSPWYAIRDEIKSVEILDGVSSIGDMFFFDCQNLESVTIADTVVSIGRYAFYDCHALSTIIMPSQFEEIGTHAFYGCEKLTDIANQVKATKIAPCAMDIMGDKDYSFAKSRAMVDATYAYLNKVYLIDHPELGFDMVYVSNADIELLQNLSDSITENCTTDAEKCAAIYDWIKENISTPDTGIPSGRPMDVVRTKLALCTGYARLTAILCELAGFPSAVIRGIKENTTSCTLEFSYTNRNYTRHAHEWTLVYYDNDWHLFDALWNYKGLTDRDEIATWYFTQNVDGVVPYCEGGVDPFKGWYGKVEQIYYTDNGYFGRTNFQVGGGIRYSAGRHEATDSVYHKYLDKEFDFDTLALGQSLPGGVFGSTTTARNGTFIRSFGFIRDNSTALQLSFVEWNNQTYFGSVAVPRELSYYPLVNGQLALYQGAVIEDIPYFADWEFYEGEHVLTFRSSDPNVLSVDEKGTITAVGRGSAEIECYCNGVACRGLPLYVYGDVLESNELVQSMCNHQYTHLCRENITAATGMASGSHAEVYYCNYCGKEISSTEKETLPIGEVTLSESIFAYDGTAHFPEVVVYDTEGNIIPTDCYDVTYDAGIECGTHQATINFKKLYEGQATAQYQVKTAVSISVSTLPIKLNYLEDTELLDTSGGVITVTYSDESKSQVSITNEMVSGFDNAKPGKYSLTVTHGLLTCTYDITIEMIYSGTCGDDLTWVYENDVLTISGTGEMFSKYATEQAPVYPWCDFINEVKEIIVEDTVEGISFGAFNGCSSLEKITLPFIGTSASANNSGTGSAFSIIFGNKAYDGSITVEQNIGYNCRVPLSLQTVVITSPKVRNGAFQNCSMLKKIEFPNGIESIGDKLFYECSSLTEIEIPANVESIGGYAFFDCDGLTEVTIPDSVKNIGRWAFYGCDSLRTVTIKGDLDLLEDHAFQACSTLETVNLSKIKAAGSMVFYYTAIKTVTFAEGVEQIPRSLFSPYRTLRSVTLPESLTDVGAYAFLECRNLKTVYYGGSRTTKQAITFNEENTPLKNATWVYAKVDIVSLAVSTLPSHVTYVVGQEFDSTGLQVTAYLDDGTTKDIDLTKATISGFDNTKVGKQTLTVTYEGKTCTFDVTVVAKSLASISLKTTPTKLSYLEGKDTLNVTGGMVTLHYNNDTTEDIDLTAAMVSGFDNTKVGKQTLTVTYEGKTCTFDEVVVLVGDLNSDGVRSVTDMQTLYDYLSAGILPSAGVSYCDINGDNAVNILDYQALYEMIRKNP